MEGNSGFSAEVERHGAELLAAFLAEEHARFGLPEVKLGVIPGGGGTQRLSRLVGRNRVKELIFFGEPIPADRALELGVVNRVVPEGEALSAALEWAAGLSEGPPLRWAWPSGS